MENVGVDKKEQKKVTLTARSESAAVAYVSNNGRYGFQQPFTIL